MKIIKDSFGQVIKKIMGCLVLILVTANVAAQNVDTSIVQQFDGYRKNALKEKLFVHTDKNFFLAGEICWFKVYVTDAFFHRPLDISKVVYVELLDHNNKPILQAKIALDKGEGTGSLYMPVTIGSGNYHLRAYSNWMKNFGADYFFQKRISVINTRQVTELAVNKSPTKYDIQFFPEGGNLVNGLSSKIGFRVADQKGKGVDCEGVILNEKNDTATRFQSLKFGLGNFNLTPKANHRYSAIITMRNGTKVTRDLPEALSNGFVMQLAAEGDKQVRVSVQRVAKETANESAEIFLFVHTRESVKAALTSRIQNGIASFLIDKDKIGDGISHFTLFNSEHKPVCERLYFKYPTKKLLLAIDADKTDYTTRQKINIRINSTDENKHPVAAAMSMAVYRVDSLQLPSESGIGEYLWLTSDLAGNVESPEYYFNANDSAVIAAMDNLMLVNGWRRFRWEDVLQATKPYFNFAPEFNGHMVTGKINQFSNGAPAANIDAYLSVPGTINFRTSRSDDKGNIKFELKNFYASPGIIVQTNPLDSNSYRIEINDPFSKDYSTKLLPEFLMPSKNPVTLLDQSIATQVENIYYGDVFNKVKNDLIDTTNFYQRPNAIYPLDKYTRFTTMEEVLREYVMPINVRKRNGRYHLPILNDADIFSGFFDRDPLVLMDGVPVFDMDKIIKYDPLKVRKLEAITRRYYYGRLAFDGIANFVTYDGNLEGLELDPNAAVLDYEGLQLQREFYSPVYESIQESSNHLPDFRNLLNWAPQMRTGNNGIVQNSFYSSDLPGKYVVEVEALSQDGKTGSARLLFEVKKAKN